MEKKMSQIYTGITFEENDKKWN